MKPTFEVTIDNTESFKELINKFRNDKVLFGIPSTDESRNDTDEINNASILAMNEFGSPLNNIPPVQPMRKGLQLARDEITLEFAKAAKTALNAGSSAIDQHYERIGIIVSNSVKKVINEQIGFPPPKESTLEARKYLTKSGFKGTKRLLVTGQLRNAITYVVQKGL
jgi:hypothetical protein